MKPVGELLGAHAPKCVQKTESVLEAARLMTADNIGAVSVLDGEQLVGIFSERDIMTRVVSKGLAADSISVEQVMTPNPIVVDAHTPAEECLRIMNQAKCRHLPVVTNGQLIGMVSIRDLLLNDIRQKDGEIEMMRAFIHYVPPFSTTPGD